MPNKKKGKFKECPQSRTILHFFSKEKPLSNPSESSNTINNDDKDFNPSLFEPIVELDYNSDSAQVVIPEDDDIQILTPPKSVKSKPENQPRKKRIIALLPAESEDMSPANKILKLSPTPHWGRNTVLAFLNNTPIRKSLKRNAITSPRMGLKVGSITKRNRIKRALSFDSVLPEIVNTKPFANFPPYYLSNFQHMAFLSIFNVDLKYLFNKEDLKFANDFKKLSPEAQKLFVRLFQRKYSWFRPSKVNYDDISDDMIPVFEELCEKQFVEKGSEKVDTEEMLNTLMLPELKILCKDLKLPFTGKKDETVKKLLNMTRKSKGIFGSKSFGDVVRKRVKDMCSEIYRLSGPARNVFIRGIVLSSLPTYSEREGIGKSQLLSLLFVIMGKVTYPDYPILRKTRIYPERRHLIQFVEALEDNSKMYDYIDGHDWESGIQLCDEYKERFKQVLDCPETRAHDEKLLPFLRYFTPGSLYCHILSLGVEVLQKAKEYDSANALLHLLAEQNVYLTDHKGRWFDRLALNYDLHLRNKQLAFEVIESALKDESVKFYHRLALSQRAIKIVHSGKGKFKLEGLDIMEVSEFPKVVISGRQLPRNNAGSGSKSNFVHPDCDPSNSEEITICTVEELVIAHYKNNGFPEGIHGEGSTFHSLLGIFFWDIIYEIPIPDVFQGPYQHMPLDISSCQFYESRKSFFDDRLGLLKTMTIEDMDRHIESVWCKHHGKASLVVWSRFKSLEHFQGLVSCFGNDIIVAICERLIKHFRHTRSGVPDIVVWNPVTKEYKISEVKGPNDKLSTKQMLWLDFLHKVGAIAEVCHVQALGFKHIVQQYND